MKNCPHMVAFLLLLLTASCGSEASPEADKLLARVHQKELYLSDLDGMFAVNSSAQDSANTISLIVNRWIRDAAVETEAERKLPSDIDIDEMVRDYRTSLIRSHYERQLENERVDTSFTDRELQSYFDAHQDQFLLERPIIRCFFIKVPHPTPEADELRRLWNHGEVQQTDGLSAYCDQYAELSLLDPDAWYKLDEISDQCPPGTINAENLSSRQEFSLQSGRYRYYFRLFEKKNRLEVSPFSYVSDRVKAMIMHERKREALSAAREEIYQRDLDQNEIEIFDH